MALVWYLLCGLSFFYSKFHSIHEDAMKNKNVQRFNILLPSRNSFPDKMAILSEIIIIKRDITFCFPFPGNYVWCSFTRHFSKKKTFPKFRSWAFSVSALWLREPTELSYLNNYKENVKCESIHTLQKIQTWVFLKEIEDTQKGSTVLPDIEVFKALSTTRLFLNHWYGLPRWVTLYSNPSVHCSGISFVFQSIKLP